MTYSHATALIDMSVVMQLKFVPELRLTHEDWDLMTDQKSLLDTSGGLTLKSFEFVMRLQIRSYTTRQVRVVCVPCVVCCVLCVVCVCCVCCGL